MSLPVTAPFALPGAAEQAESAVILTAPGEPSPSAAPQQSDLDLWSGRVGAHLASFLPSHAPGPAASPPKLQSPCLLNRKIIIFVPWRWEGAHRCRYPVSLEGTRQTTHASLMWTSLGRGTSEGVCTSLLRLSPTNMSLYWCPLHFPTFLIYLVPTALLLNS